MLCFARLLTGKPAGIRGWCVASALYNRKSILHVLIKANLFDTLCSVFLTVYLLSVSCFSSAMWYTAHGMQAKIHRITYILSKNIFRQNSTRTPPPPQLFFAQFWALVPHGSNFGEKYFLIKYMLFDVVFHADSEYHVYSAFKSAIDSQNLEIRGHFLTFCHQFWKNWFSQQRSIIFQNPSLRLFTFHWRFEWCMKVGQICSKKILDRFARAGCH